MRLTTTTMISVDGVMQGLGGPEEDRRGGFERGGWAAPLFDEEAGAALAGIYARADAFLFGRWTYDVFAASWGAIEDIPPNNPVAIALDARPKYVVSTTLADPPWKDTTVIAGDIAAAVRALKARPGGELQVHGSLTLFCWLLQADLIDEINLLILPLILGQGRRLFPDAGGDKALQLIDHRVTASGIALQVYRPIGRPAYRRAEFTSTEVREA